MLRCLLVGSLLFGMGVGIRNGWIEVKWAKIVQDLNVPFLSDPEPRGGERQAR
jgi:hypothetical protein